MGQRKRITTANRRLAKVAVQCSADRFCVKKQLIFLNYFFSTNYFLLSLLQDQVNTCFRAFRADQIQLG